MASIPIYELDAATILPTLVSHSPYSITLLRRIQHGIVHPSPTAHILATFPSTPDPTTPWLAARVDLFRGRETQIVIYASIEAEHTSIQPIDTVNNTPNSTNPKTKSVDSPAINTCPDNPDPNPQYPIATFSASQSILDQTCAQFLSLLAYIKSTLLPPYLSTLAPEQIPANPGGVPLIPAPAPHAFLIGALHTGLFSLLQRSRTYSSDPLPNIRIHRFDHPPYYKYFFRRSIFSSEVPQGKESTDRADLSLPVGYRFCDRAGREGVRGAHLDLVQSRTHIPRTRAQLSVMPSVAIYHDGDGECDGDENPVAWGFLGTDGSLSTLHVEPEHRGRGLAILVSKEVMRRGMRDDGVFGGSVVGGDDGAWVHADVAGYNRASRRVMEKLGGEVLTTVTWAVVELLD